MTRPNDDLLAHRETILRWDELTRTVTLYTASPKVKFELIRKGYDITTLSPGSWQATGPLGCVSIRRVGPRLTPPTRPPGPIGRVRLRRNTVTRGLHQPPNP